MFEFLLLYEYHKNLKIQAIITHLNYNNNTKTTTT